MQVFHIAGSWHIRVTFQSAACTIHKVMPGETSIVKSPAVQRRGLIEEEDRGERKKGWGKDVCPSHGHCSEGMRNKSHRNRKWFALERVFQII